MAQRALCQFFHNKLHSFDVERWLFVTGIFSIFSFCFPLSRKETVHRRKLWSVSLGKFVLSINEASGGGSTSHSILNLGTRGWGGEWSASRPRRFTHRKSPWFPVVRKLSGSHSRLDVVTKRKILPYRDSNPSSPGRTQHCYYWLTWSLDERNGDVRRRSLPLW